MPAGVTSGHTALYVSFSNLPPMAQSGILGLTAPGAQGVSAILADAVWTRRSRPPVQTGPPTSSPLPTLPTGALFSTSKGPVMTDWFSVMVPPSAAGISVFAVLDLFHAPLSDHRQESRVLLYDPTRRKVHSWTQFDLLARRFAQELAQLL